MIEGLPLVASLSKKVTYFIAVMIRKQANLTIHVYKTGKTCAHETLMHTKRAKRVHELGTKSPHRLCLFLDLKRFREPQ